MKLLNKTKFSYLIAAAIMILAGIFMIIFPETSIEVLCYLSGAAFLIFGVVKIVNYFSKGFFRLVFQFDLGLGIFFSVIGILIFIHPGSIANILPVFIGVFWFVDGAMQFQTFAEANKLKLKWRYLLLVFAILTCTTGILLVVNPFDGLKALIIVLGISLIIDGGQNLFDVFCFSKYLKSVKSNERVVKLDDETEIHF